MIKLNETILLSLEVSLAIQHPTMNEIKGAKPCSGLYVKVAKNWREMFSVVKNGGKASQWSKKEGK
jgi:hypothetical protein